MSKKKDCFGSETYVCRTRNCPYMADCVEVLGEKKIRRMIASERARKSFGIRRPELEIRVRSKDYIMNKAS